MDEWLAHLETGDVEAAWDRFLARYRRLIFATVQHLAQDHDDVMDLFADVCATLRADRMARLRKYEQTTSHQARFSTWLVVVVRNLAIDRLRAVHGRRRAPARSQTLPPLQRRIFELVFMEGHGHQAAYELIRTDQGELTFGAFLRELAAVYRAMQERRDLRVGRWNPEPHSELAAHADEAFAIRERRRILDEALAALPPEDSAAVRLYVMEGLSAREVARLLDLPNEKAVYNRVYRALASVRTQLREAGYHGAGDV